MAGADGDTSPGAAAARMYAAADELADLTNALRVVAEDWQTQTSDAFRNERSPLGEAWPRLANTTLERRIAKLPGARKRTKSGKLTKGAQRKREEARRSSTAVKMLIDTGRLRQSIRYRPTQTGVTIDIAAYGPPHVTGDRRNILSPRPPQRNPLVIEPVGKDSDDLALIPKALEQFREAINGAVMSALIGRKVA